MRRFLITGGAGSFGIAFAELSFDSEIFVYSRDPLKHSALAERFPRIEFIVGNICNRHAFKMAIKRVRPDVVIHAAALKHLGAGERDPQPYLRVNALGSFIVAETCLELEVPQAILISSDKAVDPVNFYGLSKAMAEHAWRWAQGQTSKSVFTVLRLGNVLDSRGSVLRVWLRRKKKGLPLRVSLGRFGTHPTRFVLSLREDAKMVKSLAENPIGGVLVPSGLKAVDILDLAQAISPNIEPMSLRSGEKLHESLVSVFEEVIEIRDGFSLVNKSSSPNRKVYSSETAEKMSGEEVLEKFRHVLEEEGVFNR